MRPHSTFLRWDPDMLPL
uniref:Uncharacterized protein n=1 Tax=Anguilla anguilla TaxID=7936 RepID=A0A0E9PVB7_ANGAN